VVRDLGCRAKRIPKAVRQVEGIFALHLAAACA
jgi:hypothetical protein